MNSKQAQSVIALVGALAGVAEAFGWVGSAVGLAVCGAAALVIPVLHFKR